MTKPALLLAALTLSVCAFAAEKRLAAKIFYSAAPWDEAAYDLKIPLTADPAGAAVSVSLWGNPRHDRKTTYSFSGHEDPGGGPAKGKGRAYYQDLVNKSMPEPLQGRLQFDTLLPGKPVTGSFRLRTMDREKTFTGRFEAAWANAPMRSIP